LHYCELDPTEQRRRLERRQAEAPHTTWVMSEEQLVAWAAAFDVPTPGELDGSDAVEAPPGGFTSWDEWRAWRWPPSVS
jgi:hypothetical protein